MVIIIILSVTFLILFVFSLLYASNAVSLLWNTLLKKEAPFVPLQRGVANFVADEMAIVKDSVVYDLGCGDGRVLFALARRHPQGRYVGVEKNILPFVLAKLNFFLHGRPKNIKIMKQDMYACDFSAATHIFTYLFPEQMERIYAKLERELRKGTQLFSCAFYFKRKEPARILEIPQRGLVPSIHQKIYVYEF